MEYTIKKVEHGYLIMQGPPSIIPRMWSYSTLKEALDGLNALFKPPFIIPAGTIVIGEEG